MRSVAEGIEAARTPQRLIAEIRLGVAYRPLHSVACPSAGVKLSTLRLSIAAYKEPP